MNKKTEIPREVLQFEDNDDFDGRPYTRISYGCPECGQNVIPFEHRCPRCEQVLSWGEADVRWEI